MNRKVIWLATLAGWCAAPALAVPISLHNGAFYGLEDWDHDYKWNQLLPDPIGGASSIDPDFGTVAMTADDWLCMEPSYLTDVHFVGSTFTGEQVSGFRLTVWSDFPATPDDESHPLDPLWTWDAGPDDFVYLDGLYDVNIPEQYWFLQQGTFDNPIVYWISVQGMFPEDGVQNLFYWNFLDRYSDLNWGDDAAIESTYFNLDPWWNWGWMDEFTPNAYDGPFPPDWWKSADMAFGLTFIPTPASMALLGFGGLIATRRR